MIKVAVAMVACLMAFQAHATTFGKDDMVGVWRCQSATTIKNVPNSWVSIGWVTWYFEDGVSVGSAQGKMGFGDDVWSAFDSKNRATWELVDNKLYSKFTHIDEHQIYRADKTLSLDEIEEAKSKLIETSDQNHPYPTIISVIDKNNLIMTSTAPPAKDDIFEKRPPSRCQRMT